MAFFFCDKYKYIIGMTTLIILQHTLLKWTVVEMILLLSVALGCFYVFLLKSCNVLNVLNAKLLLMYLLEINVTDKNSLKYIRLIHFSFIKKTQTREVIFGHFVHFLELFRYICPILVHYQQVRVHFLTVKHLFKSK